jgi:hypothetical protein
VHVLKETAIVAARLPPFQPNHTALPLPVSSEVQDVSAGQAPLLHRRTPLAGPWLVRSTPYDLLRTRRAVPSAHSTQEHRGPHGLRPGGATDQSSRSVLARCSAIHVTKRSTAPNTPPSTAPSRRAMLNSAIALSSMGPPPCWMVPSFLARPLCSVSKRFDSVPL